MCVPAPAPHSDKRTEDKTVPDETKTDLAPQFGELRRTGKPAELNRTDEELRRQGVPADPHAAERPIE